MRVEKKKRTIKKAFEKQKENNVNSNFLMHRWLQKLISTSIQLLFFEDKTNSYLIPCFRSSLQVTTNNKRHWASWSIAQLQLDLQRHRLSARTPQYRKRLTVRWRW